jgi:hypothetical protein
VHHCSTICAGQECRDDVSIADLEEIVTLSGETPDVIPQGLPLPLPATLDITGIAGPHVCALKVVSEDLMRTCLSWIQPHPYTAILRHLLYMVHSFLCSYTNYFDNQLLPNDLIVIRNHGDDEEDEWRIKRALEREGDVHIKVEIQSNSEFQCLTSSPTWDPGPPRHQIVL